MADIELLLKYLAAPVVTAGLGYIAGLNKSKQDFKLKLEEKEIDRRYSIASDYANKKRRIESDLIECEKYYEKLAVICDGLLKFINSGSNMTKKIDISEYMAEIKRFEEMGRLKAENAFRISFDIDAISHKSLKELSDNSLEAITRAHGVLLDLSMGIKSNCVSLDGLINNWPEKEYIVRWDQFSQLLKLIIDSLDNRSEIIGVCRETLDVQNKIISIYAKM